MKINNISIIKKDDIDKSLTNNTRQYLVGDLKIEQILPHITDSNAAIGITSYTHDSSDLAHYHTVISEYQYLLNGKAVVLNIDTQEEFCVYEGDVFAIPTNVKHVLKAKAGTKILFIKNQCINDKVLVEMTDDIVSWTKDMNF